MQVSPFHSTKYPGVYHICTKCTEGNNMEKQYKKEGTGSGALCYRCRELESKGGC